MLYSHTRARIPMSHLYADQYVADLEREADQAAVALRRGAAVR